MLSILLHVNISGKSFYDVICLNIPGSSLIVILSDMSIGHIGKRSVFHIFLPIKEMINVFCAIKSIQGVFICNVIIY